MMSQTHEDPAQAWFNDCQTVLDQERGWSDRADETADWKLVCSLCFTTQLNSNNLEAIFEY